ncbi:MAG TPA: exodeoxyribonuclease VII small subunit [Limnochordales bacterium]
MSGQPTRKEDAVEQRETAALSFEEALARLEQIVLRIEGGDAGLEEALRLFEEGVSLARLCRQQLDRAEARIRVLVEGAGGELVEQEFTAREAQAALGRPGEGEGTGA